MLFCGTTGTHTCKCVELIQNKINMGLLTELNEVQWVLLISYIYLSYLSSGCCMEYPDYL